MKVFVLFVFLCFCCRSFSDVTVRYYQGTTDTILYTLSVINNDTTDHNKFSASPGYHGAFSPAECYSGWSGRKTSGTLEVLHGSGFFGLIEICNGVTMDWVLTDFNYLDGWEYEYVTAPFTPELIEIDCGTVIIPLYVAGEYNPVVIVPPPADEEPVEPVNVYSWSGSWGQNGIITYYLDGGYTVAGNEGVEESGSWISEVDGNFSGSKEYTVASGLCMTQISFYLDCSVVGFSYTGGANFIDMGENDSGGHDYCADLHPVFDVGGGGDLVDPPEGWLPPIADSPGIDPGGNGDTGGATFPVIDGSSETLTNQDLVDCFERALANREISKVQIAEAVSLGTYASLQSLNIDNINIYKSVLQALREERLDESVLADLIGEAVNDYGFGKSDLDSSLITFGNRVDLLLSNHEFDATVLIDAIDNIDIYDDTSLKQTIIDYSLSSSDIATANAAEISEVLVSRNLTGSYLSEAFDAAMADSEVTQAELVSISEDSGLTLDELNTFFNDGSYQAVVDAETMSEPEVRSMLSDLEMSGFWQDKRMDEHFVSEADFVRLFSEQEMNGYHQRKMLDDRNLNADDIGQAVASAVLPVDNTGVESRLDIINDSLSELGGVGTSIVEPVAMNTNFVGSDMFDDMTADTIALFDQVEVATATGKTWLQSYFSLNPVNIGKSSSMVVDFSSFAPSATAGISGLCGSGYVVPTYVLDLGDSSAVAFFRKLCVFALGVTVILSCAKILKSTFN